MEASLTVGIGPIKWVIPARDLASLVKRFSKDQIFGGPCLILNRARGFALDATTTPAPGTHTISSGVRTRARISSGGSVTWVTRKSKQ
jgi:hypothetical protein